MKKSNLIVCFAAFLVISTHSLAQNRERSAGRNGREPFNQEEFMAKRNTFLTEKMALTAEETARFIPLDNELMRKKFEIGRECRSLDRELRTKKNKTDEDYKKLLKCREEEKEKRDKLDKDYLEKFKRILSAEKILKYQNADKEFFDEFFRDRR